MAGTAQPWFVNKFGKRHFFGRHRTVSKPTSLTNRSRLSGDQPAPRSDLPRPTVKPPRTVKKNKKRRK